MSLPSFVPDLEGLSQTELLQRRKEILDRGEGGVKTLSDEDLTNLVAILDLLRRRSSAPPALRNGPRSSSPKAKVQAASDNELMDF